MIEKESPEGVLDGIILALDNNQELLEGGEELSAEMIQKFLLDINFALLQMWKRIRDALETGKEVDKDSLKKIGGMYS